MLNLIFDIDGTLLHTGGGGKASFIKAFEKIHKIKNLHNPVFKGGIDYDVYKNMLKVNRIEYDENKWLLFKKEYSHLLEKNFNKCNNRWIIFEKVFDLLEILKNCNVKLYVVTGNIYEGALIKLKKTDLLKYFEKLFTCEKEIRRIDIIKKCIKYTGNKNSVYIGDSDKDEEAAKLLNLPFIKLTDNIEFHYNKFHYNNYNYGKNSSIKILNNKVERDILNNYNKINQNCCDKLYKMYKLLERKRKLYFSTIKDFFYYII